MITDESVSNAAWKFANKEYELYPFIADVAYSFEAGARWAMRQMQSESLNKDNNN